MDATASFCICLSQVSFIHSLIFQCIGLVGQLVLSKLSSFFPSPDHGWERELAISSFRDIHHAHTREHEIPQKLLYSHRDQIICVKFIHWSKLLWTISTYL